MEGIQQRAGTLLVLLLSHMRARLSCGVRRPVFLARQREEQAAGVRRQHTSMWMLGVYTLLSENLPSLASSCTGQSQQAAAQ